MADFSREGIKFNPGPEGPNFERNLDESVITGGALGKFQWASLDGLASALGFLKQATLEAALTALGYERLPDPYALDGPQAIARLTDTDAAGIYSIGMGFKSPSGASSVGPPAGFSFADPSAVDPDVTYAISTTLATNGVSIGSGVIEVGAFPATVGGGADDIVYTLTETNKLTNLYGAIGSSTFTGFPFADRNADIRAAGSSPINYVLGVKLHSALPSNSVVDVRCTLRTAPF